MLHENVIEQDRISIVTISPNNEYGELQKDPKRASIGVRWPDQGESSAPIYETISGIEVDSNQRQRDIKKVIAHKRYPSNKIKPIIKKNQNLTNYKEGGRLFESMNFENSKGFEVGNRRSLHSERQLTNEDDQTPVHNIQNKEGFNYSNNSLNNLNMVDEVKQVNLEIQNAPQITNKRDMDTNTSSFDIDMKQGSTKIEQHFENFIRNTQNSTNCQNEDIVKGAMAIGDMIPSIQQAQAGSITQTLNATGPNHKYVVNQMYQKVINPRTMIGAMPPPTLNSFFPNRKMSNQIMNQFVSSNYSCQYMEGSFNLKDFVTTSSNLLSSKKNRMRNNKEWVIRTKTFKGKVTSNEKKAYPDFAAQYNKKRYIKPQSAKRPNVNMTSLKAYQEKFQVNRNKLLTSRNFKNEFEVQNSNPIKELNNKITLQQTLKESNSFLVSPINGQQFKERAILVDHGANKRTQSSGSNRSKIQPNHGTLNQKK